MTHIGWDRTGLFDGASGRGDFASTAHVARLLGAPVVLVVDAAGVSSSAAALLHGFATYDPRTRIGGVIYNKVGSAHHEQLLRDAAAAAGVPVLGVIRRLGQLTVPSRHLGLIPAPELGGRAAATVEALAVIVSGSVDTEAVLRLARTAGQLPEPPDINAERSVVPVPSPRIAVAGGWFARERAERGVSGAAGWVMVGCVVGVRRVAAHPKERGGVQGGARRRGQG